MNEAQRKKYGYRYERECSAEEREAIARFCTLSHPTNVPKDRETALWNVRPNKRTGKLEAGLLGCRVLVFRGGGWMCQPVGEERMGFGDTPEAAVEDCRTVNRTTQED